MCKTEMASSPYPMGLQIPIFSSYLMAADKKIPHYYWCHGIDCPFTKLQLSVQKICLLLGKLGKLHFIVHFFCI